MVRGILIDKVIFEHKPVEGGRKNGTGRGNSQCKGPGVGEHARCVQVMLRRQMWPECSE